MLKELNWDKKWMDSDLWNPFEFFPVLVYLKRNISFDSELAICPTDND